jgi:hypothetical protein
MSATKKTDRQTRPGAGKPKRRVTDWEGLEITYRTGRFSLRQLSAEFGPSAAAISRRAAKHAWTKDLSEAIRQATNAKLIAAAAAEQIAAKSDATQLDAQREAQQSTTSDVLVAAELNKRVILAHRERVRQATDVAMRMLAELDGTTNKADELEAFWRSVSGAADEENPAARAALMRKMNDFLALHARVGSIHKMLDALGKAQTLERQAFGLDDGEKPPEKPAPLDWSKIPDDRRMGAYMRLINGG